MPCAGQLGGELARLGLALLEQLAGVLGLEGVGLGLGPRDAQPGRVDTVLKVENVGRRGVELRAATGRQLAVVGRVSLSDRGAGIVHRHLRRLQLDLKFTRRHPLRRRLLA